MFKREIVLPRRSGKHHAQPSGGTQETRKNMNTILSTTIVPQSQEGAINLALIAATGATAHEVAIGIEHNTAAAIIGDTHALTGNPATPLVPGKQALLNAQLLAIKTTQAAAQVALKDGRHFCQSALGLLKPVLGARWNGNWNAAGFTAGSLRVPTLPLTLLLQLRAYYEANPARESGTHTAAGAQARVVAIQNAIQARDTAKGARWSVKASRDAAFKALRKRLIGLRAELTQLLSPEDDRWYAFGFRRPADGKQPTPVEGLVLLPIGSGTVFASWEASTRAQDYRVTWKPTESSDPETEAGLFAETQATLMSLPAGVPITIAVSARNGSGETAPTEAAVTL
jgi:hypothetical protein